MLIYPAVDIRGGSVVRLRQGRFESGTTYANDPVEVARSFRSSGFKHLHVVDLDGARSGIQVNADTVRAMCETGMDVQVGGGIRSRSGVEIVLSWGARRVIIGSVAVRQPELVYEWIREFGPSRIVIAVDTRGGKLVTDGWTSPTEAEASAVMQKFVEAGANTFICTDVERDGMLLGPAFAWYESLRESFPRSEIIASGGVSGLDDLRKLNSVGVDGVVVGRALYTGDIAVSELADLSFRESGHAR